MPKSFRLQELSWQDVEQYLATDKRIVIPVGSTEQHGCFAPLGTDTYAALALAEDACQRSGALMAPPLWYGWSPHHMARPGTITVEAETLIALMGDVIGSLAEHGFTRFVIVNGHRIVNIPWLQIAAERAQRVMSPWGVRVALFDPAWMSKSISKELGFGPIGHAEEIEISHMLHKHPELVDLKKARDNPHREKENYHISPCDTRDTLCHVPLTREDLEQTYARTGDTVGGCPTQADAEKGKRYHEHLVGKLVEVLEGMKG